MKIYYDPRKNRTPVVHYIILGNDIKAGINEVEDKVKDNTTFKRLVELGAVEIKDEAKAEPKKTTRRSTKTKSEPKTDTKDKSTEDQKKAEE